MQIRDATTADIEAIARIHVTCWQTAYRDILPASTLEDLRLEQRAALWRSWIAGPDVQTLVAVDEARIVGFTRLCRPRAIESPPAGAAEVTHLYVDPAAQARGAGKTLLEEAVRRARSAGYRIVLLWVLEQNGPARRFYERFGLTPDGARHTDPAYLGNDAVEVRYRMRLEG